MARQHLAQRRHLGSAARHRIGAARVEMAARRRVDRARLIRRDPRDSCKTIIPDLAHSWEIAKDGKTSTFHLRQGVQFHDGAELTAEDVKATFDRIAKPPQGVSTSMPGTGPAARRTILSGQ